MHLDDPRHGTHAGAQRHWKDDESPCDPCMTAARRAKKERLLDALAGTPRMVELGTRAHKIVSTMPKVQVSAATGIRQHRLRDFELAGPTKRVHRDTRRRILEAGGGHTNIGVQRRLQALSIAGWSMRVVGDQIGVEPSTLSLLRRKRQISFIRLAVAISVVDFYDAHRNQQAPAGVSATEARNYATRMRWAPAHAWIDIDNPDETPDPGYISRNAWQHGARDDVDPVIVDRIIAGDMSLASSTSKAEKVAVVERWEQSGRALHELEVLTGWDTRRYRNASEEAAA